MHAVYMPHSYYMQLDYYRRALNQIKPNGSPSYASYYKLHYNNLLTVKTHNTVNNKFWSWKIEGQNGYFLIGKV